MNQTPSRAIAVPMPTIVWKEKRTTLTGGRRSAGTESRPVTLAFGSWKASSDSAFGIAIPSLTWPSVYQPRMCTGAPLSVDPRPSSAASLIGCVVATSRAAQSPTRIWTGDATRRDRQRDHQRCALVASPAPAQAADRVGAGDEEAGDDVAGDVHVHELVPEVAVGEQRPQGVDVDDMPADEAEAGRMVHPGVDGDDHQRAGEARQHDRDPRRQVGARGEAIPAVDVDADEDRLDEEREPLDREARGRRRCRTSP